MSSYLTITSSGAAKREAGWDEPREKAQKGRDGVGKRGSIGQPPKPCLITGSKMSRLG